MNLSPKDKQVIEKLTAVLDKVEIFDTDEVIKIRKMISVYESFVVLGVFAKTARSIFIFGGTIAAFWLTINDWSIQSFKKLITYLIGY